MKQTQGSVCGRCVCWYGEVCVGSDLRSCCLSRWGGAARSQTGSDCPPHSGAESTDTVESLISFKSLIQTDKYEKAFRNTQIRIFYSLLLMRWSGPILWCGRQTHLLHNHCTPSGSSSLSLKIRNMGLRSHVHDQKDVLGKSFKMLFSKDCRTCLETGSEAG